MDAFSDLIGIRLPSKTGMTRLYPARFAPFIGALTYPRGDRSKVEKLLRSAQARLQKETKRHLGANGEREVCVMSSTPTFLTATRGCPVFQIQNNASG